MERSLIFSLGAFIVIAIVAGVLIAKAQAKHYFYCKHCGKTFQPKWTQMIFEIHVANEHKIECPYCKVKDFCEDRGKE